MNSVCVKTFLWLTCLSVGVQLIQAKPQKYCKDPGVPRFVRRFKPLSSQGFKPGTILNYYCPPKFIFKGSKDLKCNTNGKWNATLPACEEPKCAAAKLPAYTYVIRPKNWRGIRAYGSRLSLGCNPGYKTTQRGSLVCVTPAWNVVPSNFKCFPKSCTDPGRPRHGDRKGQFTFGQKVYFTCDKCYKLKGPRHRQCQANQKWSDTQPTCERAYCGRPQALLNGFLGLSTLECGRTAQYRCRYGYKLVGPSNRTCQSNETWSGAEPICVVATNIALNKPAKQSSNSWFWRGPASRAVDGNRNPNYFRSSSCSNTKHERGPWWTVDLLKEDTVAMVIVVNRKNCCHHRLNNFQVRVGNRHDGRKNALCGGKARPGPGEVVKIVCSRVLHGRYVTVALPDNKYTVLTLCEVEVYRNVL